MRKSYISSEEYETIKTDNIKNHEALLLKFQAYKTHLNGYETSFFQKTYEREVKEKMTNINRLIYKLEGKHMGSSTAQTLINFREELLTVSPELIQSRDRLLWTLLKFIATVLTLGLAYHKIWQVEGKDVVVSAQNILKHKK